MSGRSERQWNDSNTRSFVVMSSDELILWGDGTSRTFRCVWMLEELKVPFTWKKIRYQDGETRTPEFLAVNPRGKVPALTDGGVSIAESAAINTYLGDKFGSPLVPRAGTRERGLYDMWCFFLISECDSSLVIWGRHHYYEAKNGAAPAALAAAKEYFRRQMKVVADELGKNEYLMGPEFTAADILLVTIIRWCGVCILMVLDTKRNDFVC